MRLANQPCLSVSHLLCDKLRRRVATSSRTSPYPSTSTRAERDGARRWRCPSAASGVSSRLRLRDLAPRGEPTAEPERARACSACPLAAPGSGRGPGRASRAHGALDAMTRPGGRCTRGWPFMYLAAGRSSREQRSPHAVLKVFDMHASS